MLWHELQRKGYSFLKIPLLVLPAGGVLAISIVLTAMGIRVPAGEVRIYESKVPFLYRQVRPQDGAAFDHVMAGAKAGARIVIGPGVFETRGRVGFVLKTGQRVSGAGAGRTVLRLQSVPQGDKLGVVVATEGDACEGVILEDLTVDCNYQPSWGEITVQAVNLAGSGHMIRRVEARRAAGWAQECFALGVYATTRESRGNLVEDCVVREYDGGWCTAIFLVNNSCLADPMNPEPVFTGGVVRRNHVDLRGARFPKGGGCAYGGGGLKDVEFVGNSSERAVYGFNFDTTRLVSTAILDNRFSDCFYKGINARSLRPGDRIENLRIEGNVITLRPEQGHVSAYGIAAGGSVDAPALNLVISGNVFRVANPGATQIIGLQLFGWTGTAAITDNMFDPAFGQNLQPGPVYQIERNSPEIRSESLRKSEGRGPPCFARQTMQDAAEGNPFLPVSISLPDYE